MCAHSDSAQSAPNTGKRCVCARAHTHVPVKTGEGGRPPGDLSPHLQIYMQYQDSFKKTQTFV